MRGVDHIGGDDQIVVDEFAAQRVVGDDAADLRRRQKHRLRALFREPAEHRGLVAQIDLAARHGQQFDVLLRQPAHQRAADHAAMARRRRPSCLSAQTGFLPLATSRRAIARSPATISLTSSAKVVFGFQPSFLRALLASPIRQIDLGRAEIDADRCEPAVLPDLLVDAGFLDALAAPLDAAADFGERQFRRIRAPSGSRRSPARNRRACRPAGSGACPRHNPWHGPSRAWRRDCRDRASLPDPVSMRATLRVILRVTKVSPRIGLSWLNRMPLEA